MFQVPAEACVVFIGSKATMVSNERPETVFQISAEACIVFIGSKAKMESDETMFQNSAEACITIIGSKAKMESDETMFQISAEACESIVVHQKIKKNKKPTRNSRFQIDFLVSQSMLAIIEEAILIAAYD